MTETDATNGTATESPVGIRERADGVLRDLVGRNDVILREDQWLAVDALVSERRRVLVVQRTGWGKSAVYFVATRLLREGGAGPTLIVSPLLALMRNQVDAAERAGIRSRTLNSGNVEEWAAIEGELDADTVDVLLVSPERLNNPDFRERVLPDLAARVGLLVVDEAHCVSDWGHDFRPDYRRIRDLLARLGSGVPVLGTTATANARVVTDVVEQLAAGDESRVLTLRGSLARDSLRLSVVDVGGDDRRLAWLAAHLDDLPGSGIVYTLTVRAAEEVAGFLGASGHRVLAYSGRTDTAERLEAERALLANDVKALVATSALGMGFDKPDLGFVVHLGAPSSPIAYYQQVGRAGRAVDRADVVLLPGPEDEAIWRYFAGLSFPEESAVRRTLAVLAESPKPLSTAALEARVDLRRTRLEMMLKVLDVDGAVRRVRGGWEATGRDWSYDADRYDRVARARAREQEAMRDYLRTSSCRMEFLQAQLDDPHATPCGRCDTCAAPFLPADVPSGAVDDARSALARPGVEVEPRTLWPTGAASLGVAVSGRIGAGECAAAGRAVARLTDLGWGPRLRAVLGASPADGEIEAAPDGPVEDDLVSAAVDVLRTWDWVERPQAVVAVPSRTRPQLVTSLARRIAEIGRLPYAGELLAVDGGPRGARGGNSAFRLAAVWGRFAVPDAMVESVRGASVLLVDDVADSRWTLTVAARELRTAGATSVLPFVLALEG